MSDQRTGRTRVTWDENEERYDGPMRTLRIENVPLPDVLALKQKAAGEDTTMAELVRKMIAKAVK